MKNQSGINDIFQNESGKSNKTKTILLLTIVAIILIVTFLIIAWVMARDNTIESIQLTEDNQNIRVLNQPPYAHNVENSTASNNTLTSNLDPFDIDVAKMSDTPPASIPSLNPPAATQKTNDIDNDPKILAKMQELQQKHMEKNKNTQPQAKDSDKPISINEKVTPTPTPKETPLKAADSKNQQTQTKQPTNESLTKERPPKNENKAEQVKEAKTAQTPPPPPVVPTNTSDKPKSSNIIEKKTRQTEDNGKAATKGHYIQVGSFAGSVDKNFLNRISKYPYRIKTESRDGKTIVKYLIGPYSSRVEANSNIQKIKEIQGNAFYTEIK
ncbi:hypothetical protein CQA66_04120 [Helicobacter aurati]|uniref:SPOR domain-containing protein n=1 Tax=Helicobacter aurati TaxID=137778 RepID=A0A3D8J4T4_9HELI|nr:SPOR domain-containing protein [Helicobacter aurati]RDU72507.1 hypothetical protein CQA66_04120 [Helicobacter aurati]